MIGASLRLRTGPTRWIRAFAGAILLFVAPVATHAASPAVPVIIDTDVGDDIDDAFAIALAASNPRLEVLGVTTAWGDTHLRARLSRRLLEAAGRADVTIARGVSTPDDVAFTQAPWALRAPDVPAPDAIAYIAEQARRRPGEVTLIELAPMSNLAALMHRFPDAVAKLKQIVFMGGSVHSGYADAAGVADPRPSAEYNVASRPLALAALLKSGVRLVMFPLDSTQLKFDEARRARLFARRSKLSEALRTLYSEWRVANAWGQLDPVLFDCVPVIWLLDPAICPVEPLRVSVDAKGFTRPQAGPANVQVCLSLHEDAAQRLILQTLAPVVAPLKG